MGHPLVRDCTYCLYCQQTIMRRLFLSLFLLLAMSTPAHASDLAGFLASLGLQYERGVTFDVTVTLDNTSTFGGGPLNTTNPTAVLTIPNGLQVNSWSIPGGSCATMGSQLTCSYPGIAAGGTESFTVTLEGTMVGTHELPLVVSHDDFDPGSNNNNAQLLFTITEPTFPVLETTKTASLTDLGIGELVTYTIQVRNTGTADATGVQVQDALPDGLEFVSSDDCIHSLGVVTCTTASVPPNSVVEYTITVSTTKSGNITNTASATSSEVSTPATATAEIIVRKRADVSIEKDMSDRAIFGPGSQVFTLTVTNHGPDEAGNVVVTDNLPLDPQSTMPVFADPTLPQGCSGGQAVTCQLGTMAAGESRIITFGAGFNPDLFGSDPLIRPDIVSYTNTASVTTSSNDENAANNESSASGKVLAPPGEGQDAPWTEWVNDPVNPATGEMADTFGPDLTLSGPYPVFFARSYASFMDTQGVVVSGLGPNWSHNLAWQVNTVDAFGEVAYRLVSPTGTTYIFGKNEQGELIQESALFAPMQLKETVDGFMAGDPRSGIVRTFDADGRLVAERTRSGVGITLAWTSGELQSVTNGMGQTLSFTWSDGRIASVTDGTRTVSYGYAQQGWLSSVNDAAGQTETFSYATGFSIPMLEAHTRQDGVARFTQTYDSRGRVVTQTDALGGVTRFEYGETSTTVTDPANRATTYSFNDARRLVGKTDASGSVSFTYDGQGRRASITDRSGGITRFVYDEAHGAPTSVQLADGTTQTAAYASRVDVDGFTIYDLTSRTDEGGNQTSYALDASGNRSVETLPTGETRTATFNASGQPLSITVSGKGTTTFSYDGSGNMVGLEDPDGRSRTFSYDGFGRLVQVQFPDGRTNTFTYDALDRVTGLGHADGTSTGHTFDAVGNLTSVTNELGNTASFTYDDMDQVVREGDFLGQERLYTYDAAGQLLTETDRTGRTTAHTYDASGNRVSTTNAAGLTTTFTYDAEGIHTGTAFPGGASTTVTRNARGQVSTVVDGASASTTLSRNAAGEVTGITGAAGSQSTIAVDAIGRMTGIDHDGGSVSISYDAGGRVSAVSMPNGSSMSFTADAAGRMTSRTDGLGRSLTYAFDAAGRMSSIHYADGTSTTYGYDNRGRLTSVDAGDAAFTNRYDGAGRLVETAQAAFGRDANGRLVMSNGFAASRDAEGRIQSFSYPSGDVTYSYDSGGRLSSVTDWDGRETTFSYDSAGRMASITRPNGTAVSYTYSSAGVLLDIEETHGGTSLMRATLERDAAARVMSAEYEGTLVPEALPSRDEPITLDAAWQIEGYVWDDRGRLVNDGRHAYAWNGLNRLVGFDDLTIAHDGLGMPTTIGSHSWTWNYATGLPTAALHESVAAYIYTPAGELLYRISTSGEAWYYHFDEMGSTRLITNDAGEVVAAYAYDPFGRSLGSFGHLDASIQPFTYRGQEGTMHLGDDVYQMRSRVYDAWTARFLSPDPLMGLNPLHLNPYQYAANNPSLFSDPLGQREKFATGIGVAGIYKTTEETLEALSESGKTIRQLLNSGKLGSVVMHGENGLARAAKLGPNASGAISVIAETYTSGNVARGLGVGAVDVALTANPYMAVIVIASDLTDLGVSAATGGEVQGLRLADIWRNGGRFVGSLATDLVLSPISSEHDFGDSLSNLANDMYDQDGVPGLIFDAGATVYIWAGNSDLAEVYEADAAAELLDRDVRRLQLERQYSQQRELREFFRPIQNR